MYPARFSTRRRGFSLLEVIIASGVLAITVTGAITAMYVTSRMARDARYDIMAMEALNRQVELLKAGDYENLGPRYIDVPDFEGLPTNNYVRGDSPLAPEPWEAPLVYDPGVPDNAPTFTVDYQWYGFGIGTNGSDQDIQVDASTWPADIDGTEFIGSYLTTPQGPWTGGGQAMLITGATASGTGASRRIRFTLSARLINDFTNGTQARVAFGAGTPFQIDGGKWCRVSVSWLPPWAESRAAATGNTVETYRQTRIRDVFIGDIDPT